MIDDREMGGSNDRNALNDPAFAGAGSQDDQPGKPAKSYAVVNEGDPSEEEAEAAMLKMLEEQAKEPEGTAPEDLSIDAQVAKAEFQQLQQGSASGDARNLDLLMDVDLPVAIELGRTKLAISEILALGPGSVVELNKLAGEPVDLLVNSKVVARGEVVVIDENFGLRITQLITPEERLRALGAE